MKKKATAPNGSGVRMCHHLTPPIINIKKDRSAINAAVPKSSTIISATTMPTTKQTGKNLFQNSLIPSPHLPHTAARKKMTAHFASSDGWKLTDIVPSGIFSQR